MSDLPSLDFVKPIGHDGEHHPMRSTPPAAKEMPSVCPVCGAYSLAPEGEMSALLAVCDVLVLKALEKMGNYIVRAERSRFRSLGTRPAYVAHTLWPVPDETVDKALRGAWEVVPALLDIHGCCDVTSIQVTKMLDEYVHDLVITGTAHSLLGPGGLMYRFKSQLGLPVYWHAAKPDELLAPLIKENHGHE
ncbi:hypothetical protein HOT31_gp051 [Microbacterium phage Hendrix]|uniref:Uncharacterized protein n=1 Tax=Microbacterium phage Hendrix TaxID=2182341 RepID=A0A2U8UUH6_9CAUD|nr:hypothetical protein HOT31_gp051 [Microbacterium phage Hendrix]AWN07722.1 hypothetical protein PBI_HENDRIX_51 [Microbacterium phage Hendrix]